MVIFIKEIIYIAMMGFWFSEFDGHVNKTIECISMASEVT